jgi:hypothetical protein
MCGSKLAKKYPTFADFFIKENMAAVGSLYLSTLIAMMFPTEPLY